MNRYLLNSQLKEKIKSIVALSSLKAYRSSSNFVFICKFHLLSRIQLINVEEGYPSITFTSLPISLIIPLYQSSRISVHPKLFLLICNPNGAAAHVISSKPGDLLFSKTSTSRFTSSCPSPHLDILSSCPHLDLRF